MKIAILSRYQNTSKRGAEVFVKEIAQKLSDTHQIDILSGSDADSLSKVLEGKYDLVIPINGRFQALKISLGRLVGKYKIIISGHSGRGWDDIWNIVIGKPDIFVALTNYLANWAKKWAWGSKVVKISNGIDLNKFKPNGEKINFDLPRPIILSVGALVTQKHHEKVIEAVNKMGKGSVLIIGSGPEKENLERFGRKLLGENFQIKSFEYEQMPKVYRSCDLFTLPSWDRESFGLVYLEALASGLGVVGPNDESRREIIGEAGVLVDVANIYEYADALNKTLNIEWSKKAITQAEKFSWENIAKEYEKIINRI